jgi:hypothetical protein
MPRGPKGEKRAADVIGNAVHVMRIATEEIEETLPSGRTRSPRPSKNKKRAPLRDSSGLSTPGLGGTVRTVALVARP